MGPIKEKTIFKPRPRRIKGIFPWVILLVASMIGLPTAGMGADGYWWGSAITPGFDRNTVIQVEGIASGIFFISGRRGEILLKESLSGKGK